MKKKKVTLRRKSTSYKKLIITGVALIFVITLCFSIATVVNLQHGKANDKKTFESLETTFSSVVEQSFDNANANSSRSCYLSDRSKNSDGQLYCSENYRSIIRDVNLTEVASNMENARDQFTNALRDTKLIPGSEDRSFDTDINKVSLFNDGTIRLVQAYSIKEDDSRLSCDLSMESRTVSQSNTRSIDVIATCAKLAQEQYYPMGNNPLSRNY